MLERLIQESDKLLILTARFSGLAFAPVFGTSNIPALWKVYFLLLLTFTAWSCGIASSYETPGQTLSYAVTILSEVLIGLIIALIAQFLFAGIQVAGQMLDTQMGFGIMNVIDPMSGTQAPILGNFKFILAMMVFLVIDGHHWLIKAYFDSYRILPVGLINVRGGFLDIIVNSFGAIFVIGLKLSLPIMATLLFTDFVLGIMARTVPQMNIFMVGMPAKILLGFGVLLAVIPLYIYYLNKLIADMITQIYQVIRSLL